MRIQEGFQVVIHSNLVRNYQNGAIFSTLSIVKEDDIICRAGHLSRSQHSFDWKQRLWGVWSFETVFVQQVWIFKDHFLTLHLFWWRQAFIQIFIHSSKLLILPYKILEESKRMLISSYFVILCRKQLSLCLSGCCQKMLLR